MLGRSNDNGITPSTHKDHTSAHFMSNLNLQPIPINTHFSRQGKDKYASTSLKDGFYINPTQLNFTCTKHTSSAHNSYHFPTILRTPQDLLVRKTPGQPPTNQTPKLLNPILKDIFQALNTKFKEVTHQDTLTLTNYTNIHRSPTLKTMAICPTITTQTH